jgi:hypothetical protein
MLPREVRASTFPVTFFAEMLPPEVRNVATPTASRSCTLPPPVRTSTTYRRGNVTSMFSSLFQLPHENQLRLLFRGVTLTPFAQGKSAQDFVAAWVKMMNVDRFERGSVDLSAGASSRALPQTARAKHPRATVRARAGQA